MQKIIGNNKFKIAYHQYELIELNKSTFTVRFIFRLVKLFINKIDLFICPELNRINYFKSSTGYTGDSLLLYNSLTRICISTQNIEDNSLLHKNKLCIGHIGNLGFDHYAIEFIKLISACKEKKNIYFILIGNIDKEIRTQIMQVNNQNVQFIGEIPHEELNLYYQKLDIGLILYRGVDLNFEYCAPNKLFEYWSHGIFVIAGNLAGLKSLGNTEKMMKLYDFSDASQIIEFIENSLDISTEARYRRRQIFAEKFTTDSQLNSISTFLLH